MAVPERLQWTVETLAVAPSDRLLEIGCGRGVAVSLICDKLVDGHITAIDRSEKMISAAADRNASHVAAGKAGLRVVALEEFDVADMPFDKIFAVNVNLFWVRSPAAELSLIRRLLTTEGALYLFYDPPGPTRAQQLLETLPAVIEGYGFATTQTLTSPAGICVMAR